MATTSWSLHHRDDASTIRQSFPVTVRESDSYGSLVDVTQSPHAATSCKRESIPPPPVPPKPITFKTQFAGTSASEPAEKQFTTANSASTDPSTLKVADKATARSSTPWLNLMFQDDDDTATQHTSRPSSHVRHLPELPPRPSSLMETAQRDMPPSSSTSAPLFTSSLDYMPSSTSKSSPSRSVPPPPVRRTAATPPPSLPSRPNAPVTFGPRANQSTNQPWRDRLATGVSIGKEWSGKGRGLLQEGWKLGSAAVSQATTSSASSATMSGRLSPMAMSAQPMSTSSSSSSNETNNRTATSTRAKPSTTTTIFGVKVPASNPPQLVFGLPLPIAVSNTAMKSSHLYRPPSNDPVTGDDAGRWLPRIAWRCLQYLEHDAMLEEGIYRVPGRANLVLKLRTLFDAGLDVDLREIHPGDLDPHAVASLFKSWLRELPESLLSNRLEPVIDEYSVRMLGYRASISQMLGTGATGSSPGPGFANGKASDEYIERLRDWLADELDAEYYYLLRSLAFHFYRLSTHSATNKMGLANLRLILSPTLRLSPIFLAILVEERERLFDRPNHSAKSRSMPAEPMYAHHADGSQGDVGQQVISSSRTLSHEPASSNPSQSASVVSSPPISKPSPSFATPIADKFSSTFARATVSPTLPSFSSASPLNTSTGVDSTAATKMVNAGYLPSRTTENAFFVNRAQAPGSAKTSPSSSPNTGFSQSTNCQTTVDAARNGLQGLGLTDDLVTRDNGGVAQRKRPVFGINQSSFESSPALPVLSGTPRGSLDIQRGEETGSWSLLSIEERRKYFGG
ncbi:hypothetical protein OIO90_004653 [Microbotryomycetes sp. JL221]|nr:hypothetical protein OIO90_004653 [Microbotryomycetes sp. JL221]